MPYWFGLLWSVYDALQTPTWRNASSHMIFVLHIPKSSSARWLVSAGPDQITAIGILEAGRSEGRFCFETVHVRFRKGKGCFGMDNGIFGKAGRALRCLLHAVGDSGGWTHFPTQSALDLQAERANSRSAQCDVRNTGRKKMSRNLSRKGDF